MVFFKSLVIFVFKNLYSIFFRQELKCFYILILKYKIYFFAAGITVVAKGSAKPVDKDGLEYLQTDKIIMKLKIGNGQIAFDDTERPVAGK